MQRVLESVTGQVERKLLIWMAERLPRWVTSDMLTALGVVGAALCFVGYWLSGVGLAFLWLAVAGLVLNWFGDSLDGTVARIHKAERPKYGFYFDHMTDTYAMAFIAVGIGMSPYVHLTVGMAAVLGYYVVVIQALITSQVTGTFRVGLNGMGPTEIRLVIALCTITGIYLPIPTFAVFGVDFTIYDAIMAAMAALMVGVSVIETARMLRTLSVEDPPRR